MQHKDGYYVWFNALKKKENCLVFDIRFDDLRNLKGIKKIYFTHSFRKLDYKNFYLKCENLISQYNFQRPKKINNTFF